MNLEQITLQKRDISKIKENLYTVRIKFKGTSVHCSLKWKDLGFTGEELKQLNESGSSIQGITVFDTLKEANSELQKLRNDFEHNFVIVVDEQKIVTSENIEAALIDLAKIKEKADEWKIKLQENANQDILQLQNRLRKILGNPTFNLSPEEINSKIQQISKKFPSQEEIADNYLIVRTEIRKIQNLIEQLEQEKQEEEIKCAMFDLDARRELMRSKEEQIQQLRKVKDEIFNKAREIVETILLEQLEKINDIKLGKPNKILRNKITKHLERLEAILELDLSGDFSKTSRELESLLHTLSREYTSNSARKQLEIENKITEIRSALESNYHNITTEQQKTETKTFRYTQKFKIA